MKHENRTRIRIGLMCIVKFTNKVNLKWFQFLLRLMKNEKNSNNTTQVVFVLYTLNFQ